MMIKLSDCWISVWTLAQLSPSVKFFSKAMKVSNQNFLKYYRVFTVKIIKVICAVRNFFLLSFV